MPNLVPPFFYILMACRRGQRECRFVGSRDLVSCAVMFWRYLSPPSRVEAHLHPDRRFHNAFAAAFGVLLLSSCSEDAGSFPQAGSYEVTYVHPSGQTVTSKQELNISTHDKLAAWTRHLLPDVCGPSAVSIGLGRLTAKAPCPNPVSIVRGFTPESVDLTLTITFQGRNISEKRHYRLLPSRS